MKKTLKSVFVITFCFVILALASLSVSADMGPKPSLTIKLENAPAVYYLDLLVNYDGDYENIYGEEAEALDSVMFGALKSYESDGWYPALSHGTGVPLFGSVVPSEDNTSRFSYFGLPDTYKIIIVTPDGSIKVSEVQTMSVYQETISFDYETMSVTGKPNVVLNYLLQFISTFIPTLILEIIIMFIFRIPFEKNIYKIILVNFVTQVVLTIALASVFLSNGYWFYTFIIYIPLELGITAFETLVYAFWLKAEKVSRAIWYAVTANAVSAIIGGLLLNLYNQYIWIN